MKCISIVGTDPLYPIEYRYGKERFTTTVFPEAVCAFYQVDEVVLLTTDRACTVNYPFYAEKIPDARPVWIPDGKDEAGMWQIFEIVCAQVTEGEEIVFDITQGFRTLSLVAFMAIAYLKEIKQVTFARVLYGGYHLRSDDGSDIVDVLDLTGFIDILDWISAVHSFLHHADGSYLQEMVSSIHSRMNQDQVPRPPRALAPWALQARSFASAVRLSRPIEACASASRIVQGLKSAASEVQRFIPALVPLLDRIRLLEPFASLYPKEGLNAAYLEKMFCLIRYQVDLGLYQQAVTVAREWMVSVLILVHGGYEYEWLKREVRDAMEQAVGGALIRVQGSAYERSVFSDWYEGLSHWEELTAIWSRISGLRNDLAHCGMYEEPKKGSSKIIGQIERQGTEIVGDLERFYAICHSSGMTRLQDPV
ncbi:MAG: TIGR02221 family CRISPR-associated protein [Methanospirillaceae archaeon]|nr:TIGR02221 family CRISPR-associated protein [Methanospirillaceae archaeon]